MGLAALAPTKSRIDLPIRELLTSRAFLMCTCCVPSSLAVYTEIMSRRFIALLAVLLVGLQVPILTFAPGATTTAAADCCPGNELGHAGNGCPPCPAGVLAGMCCAASSFFTASFGSQASPSVSSSRFLLIESGSTPFVSESLTPNFRPPIV